MSSKLLFSVLLILTMSSCGDDEGSTAVRLPVLSAENVSIDENVANTTVDISLNLNESSLQQIIINYNTVDGSANFGSDYKGLFGQTIIFQPGEINKTISIEIINDDVKENTETFLLQFTSAINASLATKEITVTITDTDTGSAVPVDIIDKGYSTPISYANYNLVWQDEFEGTALSADWTNEIGTGSNGWGNNELQYYRKENTSVNNGYLIIEAKKESYSGKNYTSSRIITKGNQSFQYGRIDIRAILPQGKGIWPALWMLGSNISTVGWPKCGEIDIMELVGGNGGDNTVYGTLHWDNNGSYACTCEQNNDYSLTNGIFAQEFHVFSIIWDSNSIQWLVDDQSFKTVDITPADLDEFQKEFFFIFNVAVGGNWPGSPDGTTQFPQRMVVDYVRVFQK